MQDYDCEDCINNIRSSIIPRESIEDGTMKAIEGNSCTNGYWWFHPEDYKNTPKTGECEYFLHKEIGASNE